jgi:serine/threonine-protein kinase
LVPISGDVLGGRYRLEDRIASGGMGEVWRATDSLLGRGVAVKLLHTRQADDPGFQARFRHEARTMALLHHPGVADVYDYGETDRGDDAYIVMAHVDGQPLDRRIAETGRLDPATTMSIVAQAARALQAAHAAGIVHRDVKPGNLIICPDGTVVLVDFGIARSANSATLTGANEVIGSARYIAPEQVSKDPTGPATDVYALGAVAYHCLAGHPPFLGDNPISVAMRHLHEDPPPLPADVPEPVRAVVTTAMAKKAADRYPSAEAMAEAATAAASGTAPAAGIAAATAATAATALAAGDAVTQPVAAGGGGDSTRVLPVPGPEADGPPPRRRAAVWALLLAALAAVGVALAFAIPALLNPGPSDPTPPTRQQPGVSPQVGEGESGSGAPAQPGATPSAPGDDSEGPGETPAGDNPGNPGPAPSGPGGGEPTPPGDDEPTEPEPTQPAEEEEEPPPSPVEQAPATGAP